MHIWTAQNGMQYSASHVVTIVLQLCKMASEAITEHLISWASMPPDPPSLACMHTYIHTYTENPGYGPSWVAHLGLFY